jgi:hypothetical protein
MRETSQRSQYRAHNSRPNQDNIHLRNNDIDTTCDSLSFSPLHTPLQPEHTRSPMTVEMGRNRAYNDDQDGYQGTKQGDQYTAEEMEVKRKYIYMSYDRMHETIKKAKLVLEESRQKSEQWVLFKKKIA